MSTHSNFNSIFFNDDYSQFNLSQDIDLDIQELPYLQKGDSLEYIDQFLIKEICPSEVRSVENHQKPQFYQATLLHHEDQEHDKITYSNAHNFQKHLTLGLRNSIKISRQEFMRDHEIVAQKLWRVFKHSTHVDKKMLHFLLGQKNEHLETEDELLKYGLYSIHLHHPEDVVKAAKRYLAEQVLKQLKEGRLDQYVKNRRIKDKQKFKKYVSFFEEELQEGFLRKRLPKDKAQLLH